MSPPSTLSLRKVNGVAGADTENLDLVGRDVIGRQRIDERDHDGVVCPDATIDEDAAALFMFKALR